MSRIRGMRGFSGYLASSLGVTCAAALTLPLALPAATATALPTPLVEQAPAKHPPNSPDLPGSTQSLPLVPLTVSRTLGATAVQGLSRQDVRRFSLLGVVWDNPDTELHGRVQVRTREATSGQWSGWQDVETHNAEHAADPDTAERTARRVRGATAPLWVGESNGVEVRVRATTQSRVEETARGDRTATSEAPLPSGLRLELIDPGRAKDTPKGSPADSPRVGALEIPALTRAETERELASLQGAQAGAEPKIGPRPRIVTRGGWGADESLREKTFIYTDKVKAAFVHHTASGNKYTCSQAPSVIRGIYRYHVKSMGWRDIGYNFLVDRCGNIYEGRAGGVAKPVKGAHTLGFNTSSMGIAVIGTYDTTRPSDSSVRAVAQLTAWKLGLYGVNPLGKTYLTSGGGNLYQKGKNVRLNVISGHRDGFATQCPGGLLYSRLGTARTQAAEYQGR
ncbi:peptidoglycan recognition protein [Streptomyces sp. NPDC053367]|uniref:peptidoglycan recognition protein n=1 Tax=Streptomyces sp. NPDC053367 TaxID=3365700 RepID=UPI0037CF1966